MTKFSQSNSVYSGARTIHNDMNSLAYAFNQRISSGAADAHWRIPYGIFSSLFAKPRIDRDDSGVTSISEFFDYYQFTPPTSGNWPLGVPNNPEGANLQSNMLNRFLFGIDFSYVDADGAYIFNREDVKAGNLEKEFKTNFGNTTNAFSFISPGFTLEGSDVATDLNTRVFSFARRILSDQISSNYIASGSSIFGNYYGGYFGERDKGENVSVFQLGVGTSNSPVINFPNINSIIYTKDRIYLDNVFVDRHKSHIKQFETNVFLKREPRDHISRLLYFYITYASGFDFDNFFNNQYCYAPELGTFSSLTQSLYYANQDNSSLKKIEIDSVVFENARLNFLIQYSQNEFNNLTDKYNILFPFPKDIDQNLKNYKIISDSCSFTEKIYRENNQTPTASEDSTSSEKTEVVSLLNDNHYFIGGDPQSNLSLYTYYNANGAQTNNVDDVDMMEVPNGFCLHRIELQYIENLESFSIELLSTSDNENQTIIKFINFQTEKQDKEVRIGAYSFIIKKAVSGHFKFKLTNIKRINDNEGIKILLIPIFLLKYKPNVEDAYAFMRACCYFGEKDALFGYGRSHPFDKDIIGTTGLTYCGLLSDDMKKYGVVRGSTLAERPVEKYVDNNSTFLNNNAIFEAARRESLNIRIVRPKYFKGIEIGNNSGQDVLTFSATLDGKSLLPLDTTSNASEIDPSEEKVFNKISEKLYTVINFDNIDSNIKEFLSKFEDKNKTDPPRFLYDHENILYYNSSVILQEINKKRSATFSGLKQYGNPEQIEIPGLTYAIKDILFNAYYDLVYSYYKVGSESPTYEYLQFEDANGNPHKNGDGKKIARIYDITEEKDLTNKSYDTAVLNDDGAALLQSSLADDKYTSVYTLRRKPEVSEYQKYLDTNESISNGQDGSILYYFLDRLGKPISANDTDSTGLFFNIKNRYIPRVSLLSDSFGQFLLNNLAINLNSTSITTNKLSETWTPFGPALIDLYNKIYKTYHKYKVDLDTNKSNYNQFFKKTSEEAYSDITSLTLKDYNNRLSNYYCFFYFPTALKEFIDAGINYEYPYVEIKAMKDEKGVLSTVTRYDFNYEGNSGVYLFILPFIYPPTNGDENGNLADGNNLAATSFTYRIVDPSNVLFEYNEKRREKGEAEISYQLYCDFLTPSEGTDIASLLVNEFISRGEDLFMNFGVTTSYINNSQSKYIFTGIAGTTEKPEGIVATDPTEGNLTNEWIMWINFLPTKNSNSSIFKQSAYADVQNPFIDRCLVNSDPLTKYEESDAGEHINSGQKEAYYPVSPPAYRYIPIKDPEKRVVYMNNSTQKIPDDQSLENQRLNFYKSCQTSVKPYVVKSAQYIDSDKSVRITLDRPLDGNYNAGFSGLDSYRNDATGIRDWLNDGFFRVGDAAITNKKGYNVYGNGSGQANGYDGAYYPIFIFVKLIPKAKIDKNNTLDLGSDSYTLHSALKQAEWYLDIMREGFATKKFKGNLLRNDVCDDGSHLTPPDWSYSNLLFYSTGNNVLPLTTFKKRPSSFILSPFYDNNPRGYGAIPSNGMYSEFFNGLAKSISNLRYFRISYPSNFKVDITTTGEGATYSNYSDCQLIDRSDDYNYSIVNNDTPLRVQDGSLSSISSSFSWETGRSTDNTTYFSGKTSSISTFKIDSYENDKFKNLACVNISNLIDNKQNLLFARVITTEESTIYNNIPGEEGDNVTLKGEVTCGGSTFDLYQHYNKVQNLRCESVPIGFTSSVSSISQPSNFGIPYKISNTPEPYFSYSFKSVDYNFYEVGFLIVDGANY